MATLIVAYLHVILNWVEICLSVKMDAFLCFSDFHIFLVNNQVKHSQLNKVLPDLKMLINSLVMFKGLKKDIN